MAPKLDARWFREPGMHAWIVMLALSANPPPMAFGAELPGFEYVEHREYYDVDAVKLRALRRQLNERRQAHAANPDPIGRTTQRLETRYVLRPLPAGCRMDDLVVSLEVRIHLPRWRPRGRRPEELGRRWDAMLAGLTRHEEGHRDNALWAARGLHRRLLALGEDRDCLALERAAQRERFKAEARYRQRDGAYDRRTQHGVNQGSVL